MNQYDDDVAFVEEDEDNDSTLHLYPPTTTIAPAASSIPIFFSQQRQYPKPMQLQYDYNNERATKETINVEDVLLDCPHCHKTILYTSRFPCSSNNSNGNSTLYQGENKIARASAINYDFFNGSANKNINNGKTIFKRLFTSVGGGGGGGGATDKKKKRFNRCCSFLAALLIIFIIFKYFCSVEIDGSRSFSFRAPHHITVTTSGDKEQGAEGSWVKEEEQREGIVEQQNKMKRLPQCIIIGARKCGTRALIDMLNLHPQVEKAAIEVHFFDRDDNYGKGLDWYRDHMPETTEDQLSIEKSPSYFVTPEVPERIQGMNSSIKLFLIVREPVTRVISDYTQIYGINSKTHNMSSTQQNPPSLKELVLHSDGSINVHYKAIRISLYSRYLQRWLDVFPPNQIHVIDGDALIADPYSQLHEAEHFLGLQPRLQRDNFYFNTTKGFYCWKKLGGIELDGENYNGNNNITTTTATTTRDTTSQHCLNDSKGRPHPQVDRHIISRLRRFYHPHNLKFYDMVGKDFGWPEK